MIEEQTGDSEIKIDEKGILTIRINLKRGSPDDAKVLAYGTIWRAQEECSKFFWFEEARIKNAQRSLGIVTPGVVH